MTTYTWRISASGNWNTGGDWIPAGPPNSDTADAVIKTVGTHVVSISDGHAFTANQLTLDGADTTLKLASGGTLTLAGTTAALVLNAGTFVLDGLLQDGTVEAGGATAQLGGTLDGVTWLGPLTFGAGDALTVVGGLTVKTAAGGSPGIIDMSAGGDTLALTSDETLDNAILNFSGSDNLVDATAGGTLTLGSGFTLDGSGGTLTATAGNIVNSGTITLGGGSILQTPGITNSGSITIGAGSMLQAPGLTNSGSITIGSGGLLNLSSFGASLANTGSVTIGAGGELAAFEITANTGFITVGSGALLSVTHFDTDSGVVAVENGGTFLVDFFDSSQPFIDNGLLEVNDNFSAHGITIASGATLIGAATVIGSVADRGLVEANGGVLQLNNAVTGTGVLQIDAGATLQLDSSDLTKVDFSAVGGILVLEQPGAFRGTIDGFTIGDTIELPKVVYDPSGTATMLAGNTLQVVANASTYDLRFDPAQSFAGGYFHLTPDGTAIIENTIPPSYAWETAISGDWATGADWTPAGPPDSATANAVIDAIGSYTVSISNGESFLANALTLATDGATLRVAGALTLDEIISDGLIDIVGGTVDLSLGTLDNAGVITIGGGTVDLSQGTLNNAGVITIGANGTLDGELILNAVAANGGSITIAAGGTLDLLGARTLSGDTVAGLGSVTSTGGLLLVDGSLNLGGGTLDLAATGPLSEFGVAGALANGTVDADAGAILLENGAILNGVTWQGTLTVFGTESIAGMASRTGINVAAGSLINDGTIAGGAGASRYSDGWGSVGGDGETGVGVTNGMVTNSGTIAGGAGGDGAHLGSGGNGGTGISLDADSTLLNTGLITGGTPGFQPGLYGAYFAVGGAGADVTNSILTNLGTILGGASGNGGVGRAGVSLTNGMVTNDGSIAGGFGGDDGGIGVTVGGGTLTNNGAITGGSNGGFPGAGVDITNGILSNRGTITGGSNSFYGGTGVDITNGTLINDGTITGTTGQVSSGIGVVFDDGGTLNDAGFIGGGGTLAAVEFGTAASRLILDPGASFSGSVVADAAFSNVLELASAASAGTLAGLGSRYVGFARITIDAAASWMLTGANTIATGATLTVLSGATLIDSGTLVNDGAIVLDPSTMTVSGLTGTGSVAIEAASTLEAQSTIAGGETLGFGGSGAYLHLDSPDSVAGTVTNFGFGETIDLKGIDPASVSYADGRLSFSGGSFALSLANTAPVIASASGDGAAISAPCFRAGTQILTPSGERPVQELAVGDLVRTVLGKTAAPIVWVGRREVDCARHPNPGKVWPVRVAAEAFGPGRPRADLFLSPDHAVYVADVLIPVKFLINGSTIAQVPVDRVTYYHLALPEHDVLLAEGLPAESFLDSGDRADFANGGVVVRQFPDFTALLWEACGCAPLVVAGPELAAARRFVATIAQARGSAAQRAAA